MFDNIGSKIKNLAMVVCWIGIAASVVAAIVLWSITGYSRYSTTHPYVGLGFVVLIAGCLVSWISTWVLYAFGQLIENSDQQVTQNETLRKQNEEILKQLKKLNGETEDSKAKMLLEQRKTVQTTPTKPLQLNMKTCKKCGEKFSKGLLFCPSCGESSV